MPISRANKYLITGACAAFIAIVLTVVYVWHLRPAAQPMATPKEVVVAACDIPARTILTAQMVAIKPLPEEIELPGAVLDPESVVGKTTTVPIARGEPVLLTKLAFKGSALGLAFVVPQSMRAVSISVNEVVGVAGFILPGDHVDVVATYEVSGQSPNTITKTILQDVEVLAAGPQLPEAESGPGGKRNIPVSTVTLAVTPSQTEQLALLEAKSKIKLGLRPAGDRMRVLTSGTSVSALWGPAASVRKVTSPPSAPASTPLPPKTALRPARTVSAKPVIPKSEATVKVIEVFRGTQKESVSVSQ